MTNDGLQKRNNSAQNGGGIQTWMAAPSTIKTTRSPGSTKPGIKCVQLNYNGEVDTPLTQTTKPPLSIINEDDFLELDRTCMKMKITTTTIHS